MSKDKKSSYYDAGGIEVIDVIKAKLTREQYRGYLLGNALKYSMRMMHKTPENPLRDAEKAANYSQWLAEAMTPPVLLPNPHLGKLKSTVESLTLGDDEALNAAREAIAEMIEPGITVIGEADA